VYKQEVLADYSTESNDERPQRYVFVVLQETIINHVAKKRQYFTTWWRQL
jgi:hypothetical protein